MKVALFLGAGASVPYGKPTTRKLRENLIEKYGDGLGDNFLSTLLACPEFEDVEHILQATKDLTSFNELYGGKFLSWLGNQSRLVIGLTSGNHKYPEFVENLKKIKNTFENEVFENYSWDHNADQTVNTLFPPLLNFLQSKSDKITIFTTNYDRAVEEYCSRDDNNFFCVDGFKHHEYSGRNIWNNGDNLYADLIPNKTDVFLYKLHGSLNWKKHKRYGIERTTYERKPNDPNYEEDFLIYPTLSPKDEANGREPYKTILKQFEEIMNNVDACIVVGFSFRDEHINDILSKFTDKGKILIAISPHCITDFRTRILHHEPTKEDFKKWEEMESVTLTMEDGKDKSIGWQIHLIRKKFQADTIKDIIHQIEKILEQTKH
ncbi:MAG: SIR2 family protein [Candidatus Paceibacterota bacterium]